MNHLSAPQSSLQSLLLESDRESNDSLLAESIQLDLDELDDVEYSIPALQTLPTLESVLSDLDGADSDILSDGGLTNPTPTPSMDDLPKMGTILRHIVLQGVTSQIGSASDRVNAGLASSLAISDMIAVGTSHGHILAFDNLQALRWCVQEYTAQGAVSALAFNDGCTRLLAGFARGQIVMIDTQSGDVLRAMSDVITPNSGVLHLKWAESVSLALCSDSGGSVWTLNFTRRLGIRGCDSRCIFSGARGEVCAFETLSTGMLDHPLRLYSITALATLSKFVVVTVRPRLKVIKFQSLIGPSDCLPLLSWQMVLIQAADSTRSIDPVLAVARGNNLYFHQIFIRSGKVSLLLLRHITLQYNLLALHWLGPKSLGCLDTSEVLHLNDVRTNKELECIDLAGAGLVYGSAQFKGFATGGNVSPALALAGTYACYNTVISKATQLYILGARSLHSVTVRAWSDRISYLISNQRWIEACSLAIDGYRSAAERPHRKQVAKDRILRLVDEYIQATGRCPELCLDSIMSCLIEIEEYDLLWQELWERLIVPDNYLIYLSDHIENDRIRWIAPIVAQSLCDYWRRTSPNKLEALILKLDWRCLDLHQILTAIKQERLYNAQIYLNTHALGDYTISITDLVPLILDEDQRHLGNYLLVYISSCLAGRGYPTGDIAEDILPTVKHEVLRCLTSLHSNNAPDDELPYPYMRTLLKFDTRETLNVLSLAFQEIEFVGLLGQAHRQRIVNILLEIVTPDRATWSQYACLMNFISSQLAVENLNEDECLMDKVMDYLKMEYAPNESPREHSEREQAWLELLSNGFFQNIPFAKQLEAAKLAKCYRVMQHFYEEHKLFDQVLMCYIEDSSRHIEMWTYLHRNASITERLIYSQICANFEQLLEMNGDEMTKLIVDHFATNTNQLIRRLDGNEKLLFIFLNELIKQGIQLEANDCETFLNLLCKFSPDTVDQYLRNNDNYRLENALDTIKKYELYSSCIYLYEKQGDYQSAFNLSLELLKEAPESMAECRALEVSSLCARISPHLTDGQKEEVWFAFLKMILPRPDLTQITKNILNSASTHVNLSKLVELVLNSSTSSGSFGDIKHLLLGMLSNSRYETLLLQTTAKILGQDLHNLLAKERRQAGHGLAVKSVKCIVCRMRLYDVSDVIVFGTCGHACHQQCIDASRRGNESEIPLCCQRCGTIIKETKSLHLQAPSEQLFDDEYSHRSTTSRGVSDQITTNLQLEAPPRIGI